MQIAAVAPVRSRKKGSDWQLPPVSCHLADWGMRLELRDRENGPQISRAVLATENKQAADSLQTAFGLYFLVDQMNIMSGTSVTLSYNDHKSPVQVCDSSSSYGVIMPMHLG